MHARTRWPLFLSLLFACLAPLRAQDGDVKVRAELVPATAKPGDDVTLVLHAHVSPGWHAYGTLETVNIPTKLDSTKVDLGGLEANGEPLVPTGEPHDVAGVGQQFPLPEDFVVKWKLKVKPTQKAGDVTVDGALTYQICNQFGCLPPTDADFTVKLKVAAGEAAPQSPTGAGAGNSVKPGLKLVPDPVPNPVIGGQEKVSIKAKFEPATVRAGEQTTLVLTATVDPRYHAYGTKEPTNLPVAFDVSKMQSGGLEAVGKPDIPPGEKGEQFGMVAYPLPHVFVVKQAFRVPAGTNAGAIATKGVLDYQICDDHSCDPPVEGAFQATVTVADAAPPTGAGAGNSVKPGLKLDPVIGGQEKVSIKAKFEPATVRAGEPTTLVLTVTVDEHYHAYGTQETTNGRVTFDAAKMDRGGLEAVGGAIIPPGEKGEQFGMEAYPLPHVFEVRQGFRVPEGTKPSAIATHGDFECQICDDHHCEQASAAFQATVTVEAGDARTSATPQPKAPVADATPPTIDNPSATSWWALILLSIGGGLFALAMPCTYPMIPITFSFFTKQAEKRGGHVLPLVIVYGLGIIVMFTLVGVLLSSVIIDVVNHWATNTIIGVMFFFFAFVLFGWINLSPPQWMNRLAFKAQSSAQSQSSGLVTALLGVFFMGATLVITSFTCTAPIVGSLIANIASLGRVRVGVGMAIFGLTMALPFMALALMPTKVKAMPRSGEWMDTLKISLGFVELAAAFKFVSMVDFAFGWQILPRELFLFLWAAIFGMWAMYLFGILRKAGTVNEGVGNGRMAAGMFVTLLATYFLFGALGNQLDSVMTGFVPGYSKSLVSHGEGGKQQHLAQHTLIKDDQKRAIEVAKAEDKLLLYNFTGFN